MDVQAVTQNQSTNTVYQCIKLKNHLNKLKFYNKKLSTKLKTLKNTQQILQEANNRDLFEFDCSQIAKKIDLYNTLEAKAREENKELAYLKNKHLKASLEIERRFKNIQQEYKHAKWLSGSIDHSLSLAHFNYLKDNHSVYITKHSYNLAKNKRSNSMQKLKLLSLNIKQNLRRRSSAIEKDLVRKNSIIRKSKNFAAQIQEIIRVRNQNKEISHKINRKLSFYTRNFQVLTTIINNSIFNNKSLTIDAPDIIQAWQEIQSEEDKLNMRYFELTDSHRQLILQIEIISRELAGLKNSSQSSDTTRKLLEKQNSSYLACKKSIGFEMYKEKSDCYDLIILKCLSFVKMHYSQIVSKAKFLLSRGKISQAYSNKAFSSTNGKSDNFNLPYEIQNYFEPACYSSIKLSLDSNFPQEIHGEKVSDIFQESPFILFFLKDKDLINLPKDKHKDKHKYKHKDKHNGNCSRLIDSIIEIAYKNARSKLSNILWHYEQVIDFFSQNLDQTKNSKPIEIHNSKLNETYNSKSKQIFNPKSKQIFNPKSKQIYNPKSKQIYNPKAEISAFVRLVFLKKFEMMKVNSLKFKKTKRFKFVNKSFDSNSICKRSNPRVSRKKSVYKLPTIDNSKNEQKIKDYLADKFRNRKFPELN